MLPCAGRLVGAGLAEVIDTVFDSLRLPTAIRGSSPDNADPCLDCRLFVTTADFLDQHRNYVGKPRDDRGQAVQTCGAIGVGMCQCACLWWAR